MDENKSDPGKLGKPAKRGRVGLLVAGVTLVTVVIFVACGGTGWLLARSEETATAFIEAKVCRGDIEDLVTAIGSLQPRDYVDVGAQVSGQLRKIHVEVGQSVKEGDLVAEIDAEQSVARVEANMAQIRSLEAQLEQRRLSLVKAERDLVRFGNLVSGDAAPVESLQNAETEVGVMRAQMAQLRAQIDQLRATSKVEQVNLKYTRIYAPMSGTVVSIAAKKGQTLNANQSAPNLMRIADLAVMNVQAQVSEAEVGKLRLGMDAYFTTLGGQGRRWYGTLKKIEPTPTVTNNVVLYNALFEVPNDKNSLMTQMTAQTFFIVAQAHDVLVIPMSALAQGDDVLHRQRSQAKVDHPESRLGDLGEARRDATKMSEDDQENARVERRVARENGSLPPGSREGRQRMRPSSEGERRTADPPRPMKVRVILPGGGVEDRPITVGVSNRVHAEVLTGLREGEKVVAGLRGPEKGRRGAASNRQSSPAQQPRMQGLPGVPGSIGRGR